jgi:hypothetical protein
VLVARFNWLAAQVVNVEFQDVERVELARAIFAIANEQLEIRNALVVTSNRASFTKALRAIVCAHFNDPDWEPLPN